MASELLGRAECPECGHKSAHVKESPKEVYRYCPECGATYHAGKRGTQRGDKLLEKVRPELHARPAPAEAKPEAEALPTTTTPAPAATKRAGLFF